MVGCERQLCDKEGDGKADTRNEGYCANIGKMKSLAEAQFEDLGEKCSAAPDPEELTERKCKVDGDRNRLA